MSAQITNKKGFTLIELVIVLAIGALILAGVLLAVTGAQKSQRDGKRRADAGTVGALLQESAGNHSGDYPGSGSGTTWALFIAQANARVSAPSGAYNITNAGTVGTCPASGSGASNDMQVQATAARTWQVAARLESGDWFCTNGQ